jgi:hypothetical protein
MTVDEIKRIDGVQIAPCEFGIPQIFTQYVFCTLDWNGPGTGQPSHWLTSFVQAGFQDGETFVVQISHDEEGYIFPDSLLYVARMPSGIPRQ